MLNIIDPNKFIKEHELKGPVKSSKIYQSKKNETFHPLGLFSEDIFGLIGSVERRQAMSWIELNTKVINPVIYDLLKKRIERKIVSLLSLEKRFTINEDGYLEEDDNGKIDGMSAFVKNIKNIKFRKTDKDDLDGDRNKLIKKLYELISSDNFFITKLIIPSPEFRNITTLETANITSIDDLSRLYQKIINLSNQVSTVSGSLNDIFSFKIQNSLEDLYELIRVRVSKKEGMIRKLMLGRRTDFSSRSVITPNANLKASEIGVPLRIVTSLFEPHIIHGLVNSKYANQIPIEFHQAVRDFVKKESRIEDLEDLNYESNAEEYEERSDNS